MVEESPNVVGATFVQFGAVLGQLQRSVDQPPEVLFISACASEDSLGIRDLPGDPRHVGLEEVERDRPRVVRFQELGLFVLEPCDGSCGRLSVHPALLLLVGEFTANLGADQGDVVGRDGHLLVEPHHRRLDGIDSHIAPRARVDLVAAPHAEEVVISTALAAVTREHQPRAAMPTPDTAAEIVHMCPVTLPGGVPSMEHVLHFEPQLDRYQRLMHALAVRPAIRNDARVVGIHQQLVQRTGRDRTARPLGCGAGAQPFVRQTITQINETPLPGGIRLERPPDERRALRIGLDPADIRAAFNPPLVEVAEWRSPRRAALLVFRRESLEDFSTEILGVEGGHVAEVLEHHLAGRGVVEMFSDTDELAPGRLQRLVDDQVGLGTTTESIELAHDDVGDLARLQILDKANKVRTTERPPTVAGVDVFVNNRDSQLAGLLVGHFSLVRDGIALLLTTDAGLLLGRDAQIHPAALAGRSIALSQFRGRRQLRGHLSSTQYRRYLGARCHLELVSTSAFAGLAGRVEQLAQDR